MSSKRRGRSNSRGGKRIDPHSQRESANYTAPIASREHIGDVLRGADGPLDLQGLSVELNLAGNADGMEALRRRVGAMLRDGQLIENRKRQLVPVDADALIIGRISAHPDGFGFLITDDEDKDIFMNGKQMRQVLHGDRAVVCITGIDRRGRKEGRIVEVIERANKSLVGRLVLDSGVAFVNSDNKRIHLDLMLSVDELSGAKNGDMVVAEITEQPSRRHPPVGRIVEVLGQHLRPGMEIDVALHSHGIPNEWPQAVTDQAAAFSTTVPESAAKGRKDVRELSLVTIDGADARDFDDAVWCERLDNGWRLMVAIADVAHYVEPQKALDAEAVNRGTSVYFPGRVVPMLPEVLSNGLCSLNPHVDRLCMLCEMTLDTDASVKKVKFHNAIMQSHARLTYSQVNEMLTDADSKLRDQHAAVMPMIEELHRLYQQLARTRRKRGAIEFDSNDTRIVFDDDKKIREIVPVIRNDAHKLIEECMILANIQAAAWLEEREMPALYRVHAGPKADRLEDLHAFLALRGLTLGGGTSPAPLDYANLSKSIVDRADRSIIETVMLRSMQQAVYQPKNEGHFGLALSHYAHFTSPIRRYPDLLVHRALKHTLKRGKKGDYYYNHEAMQALGEGCSLTERRAEEASREVVSWLKCEYMQQHVGDEFKGVISAVTSFGLFVDLTGIHVEGLIHITNLSRDFYRFESHAHSLTGERTGRQYQLGDSMVVQVAAVNLDERKIDFAEVSHQPSKSSGRVAKQEQQADESSRQRQEESAGSRKRKRNRKRPNAPVEVVQEVQAAATATPQTQTDLARAAAKAERRRQQKRKAKQRKRDQKRAARATEQKAGGGAVETSATAGVAATPVETDTASSWASRSTNQPADKSRAASDSIPATDAVAKADIDSGRAATTQSAGKKAVVRKVAAKKTTGKKIATKKVAAQKVVAKKSAGKKIASKKVAAQKVEAKKAAGKKIATKKVAAQKVVAKKAAGKKIATKKVAAQQVVAKKAAGKKIATKKVAAQKVVAKKAAGKKIATKKVAAQKVVAKKATGKKIASKKVAAQKVLAKKAAGKKIVTKKVAAQKVVAKKATGKKIATKKVAAQKVVAKKAASKKVASKKVAAKKAVAKKAAGKKIATKNVAARKVVSKKTQARSAAKKSTAKKMSRR